MAQESADQHQILYINRTGEDGVLVCSFQMGKTHMNLEEAVAAAGGVSKIINTSKCDVYCCGLKKCRCPNGLIKKAVPSPPRTGADAEGHNKQPSNDANPRTACLVSGHG